MILLRIENGRGSFLLLQAGPTWEIRVVKPGVLARIAAWWRAGRARAALAELDARTLKDIGFDALAAQVEERHRLETRHAMAAWRVLW